MTSHLTYGSACSGVEAASLAWEILGLTPSWFSEDAKFPSAVLAHRWPDVTNLGDMLLLPDLIRDGVVEAPDIFVAGTPCQSFSVAGLGKSLDDPRGQLTMKFIEVLNEIDRQRPGDECVAVWENVPGIFSKKDNPFGCFLGGLAGSEEPLLAPRGKWPNAGCVVGPQRAIAWRVLDAQYFGVAQRRRRVFVVASARDGFDPAQILFEFEGSRRDTPPSRTEKPDVTESVGAGTPGDRRWPAAIAPTISARFGKGKGQDNQHLFSQHGGHFVPGVKWPADIAPTLNAAFGDKQGLEDQHINGGGLFVQSVAGGISHTLSSRGFDASEDGTGRGTPVVALEMKDGATSQDFSPTVRARSGKRLSGGNTLAVSYRVAGDGAVYEEGEITAPLDTATDPNTSIVGTEWAVRRITPLEAERLQGEPDNHTQIPWRGKPAGECPDSHRYKAVGNSMAVPVVRWLGRRLQNSLRPAVKTLNKGNQMPNEHSNVIGGSSAERIMNCPGSRKLSKDVPNRSTSFADEGTMLHEVAAERVMGNPVKYGFEHSGHKFTDVHDWEAIQPALEALSRIEKAFGGNFEMLIEERVKIPSVKIPEDEREEGEDEGEGAFGTTDLLGYNDKFVIVGDWKFGAGVPVLAYDNYQLRFYALGARYSMPDIFVGREIILAIFQPYMDDEPFTHEIIDNAELDRFEAQMLEAIPKDTIASGNWCRWCPAEFKCPLKNNLALEAKDVSLGVYEDGEYTLEELLDMADVLKPWIAKVYKEAQSRLEEGGGVKGWKLVPKQGRRTWNDPELTAKRLKGRKFLVDETHEPRKLKGPAPIEKMLKAKKKDTEFLKEYYSMVSSGHTMARDDDNRPAVTVGNGVAAKLSAAKSKSA